MTINLTNLKLSPDGTQLLTEVVSDIKQGVVTSLTLETALVRDEHPSMGAAVTLLTLHSWQTLALSSAGITANSNTVLTVTAASCQQQYNIPFFYLLKVKYY